LPNEPNTTIEVKNYSPEQADDALTRALRGKKGRLTKADAITVSGLPAHLVDDSLERLLKKYKSRLEVTDDGELLYTFDPALTRRDEPTLAESARDVGRALARAGVWVFKAWITVTLIVYVVGFALLVLAMMFGGNDNRRRDDDRIGGGGLSWLWWFLMPDWLTGRYGGYGYGYDSLGGRSYDAWGRPIGPRAQPKQLGAPKKKFIYSVFDFVFGPAQPEPDKLADEREILGYLRAHDGRITATDLVAMFGWSYQRAEEEVTRLLVDYDGDPEVTDEGVIVYQFPKLLKSAEETALAPATPKMAWQRMEPRPVLTGNSSGSDTLIGAFAAFNLIVSFFAASWAQLRFGLVGPTWHFFLTAFPLAFFAIFLSVPALRAGARALGDGRREARNRRREALHKVMDAGGAALPTEPALDELLVPLEGEPEAGDSGQLLVRFPRVAEERAALQKHLASVDVGAEKRIGKVIFGGDDDEVDQARASLEGRKELRLKE
jgi:hypothetical protein